MALSLGTDAYIDLDYAKTYWVTNRHNSTWEDADKDDREKAILEATQLLDGRYNWIGDHPGSNTQLLGWPRNDAVDHEGRVITGIPAKVEQATAELALLALSARLIPNEDRGGDTKRVKVGPLEVEYGDHAPAHRNFEFVDLILNGLFHGRAPGGSRRLTRV